MNTDRQVERLIKEPDYKDVMKSLNGMLKTQGMSGNWNLDQYIRGMYNGMELFMAILERRERVGNINEKKFMVEGQRIDNGKRIEGYYFKLWDKVYILWGATNGIPDMIGVIPETIKEIGNEIL